MILYIFSNWHSEVYEIKSQELTLMIEIWETTQNPKLDNIWLLDYAVSYCQSQKYLVLKEWKQGSPNVVKDDIEEKYFPFM